MKMEEKVSAAKASATDPSPMVMLLLADVEDIMFSSRRAVGRPLNAIPPRLATMVQRNEVGFDANQIAKAFSGVAPFDGGDNPASPFERLQIGDDIRDLVGIEPKLRHGRMAGTDPLGQRPL